jgi:hypothetical protein
MDYGKDKEIEGIKKQIDLLVERKNFLGEELSTSSDASTRFSLRKQIEQLDKEIAELRKQLEEIENERKNGNLKDFKKYLLSLIDACRMDEFFAAIENCPYPYDKPTYNAQKNSYTQTSPLLNPCALFSQQWKVFVGTLREKN